MTTLATLNLRFSGAASALNAEDRRALFDRSTAGDPAIRSRVSAIIARVRSSGDAALFALAKELDGVVLETLEVPRDTCIAALKGLPPSLRRSMERAAKNVAAVASADLPRVSRCEPEPGIVVTRAPQPLDRVGVYAPGGRAAYPSSLLMGAVTARVAGVREVVVCSPPSVDGLPASVVLAAAALADVDRVFALGGAGAIAAMAYGTEAVPRVDRIVGPGNAYVAEAKLQVTGTVGIEAPAGPSELLVIADDSCSFDRVAIELLGQAEHDPRACAVAIVVGVEFATAVVAAVERRLADVERRDIVEQAMAFGGGVLVVESLDEAIALSNTYAPEHLLIATQRDDFVAERVRNAGTVFVGSASSVAFGDYLSGSNHVLPTGGLARSYSGLSVLDFIRWTSYQRISPSAAASLVLDTAVFAEAEGLPGHAAAARAAGVPS